MLTLHKLEIGNYIPAEHNVKTIEITEFKMFIVKQTVLHNCSPIE